MNRGVSMEPKERAMRIEALVSVTIFAEVAPKCVWKITCDVE